MAHLASLKVTGGEKQGWAYVWLLKAATLHRVFQTHPLVADQLQPNGAVGPGAFARQ